MLGATRILVPIDFSACARAAVAYALDAARAAHAQVELLHVWDAPVYLTPDLGASPTPAAGAETLVVAARDAAVRGLAEFAKTLSLPSDVEVSTRLEHGHPDEQIPRLAADFDLIVMGNHGRTGPARWALGSVAERVIRRAPCPVLTVHAEAKPTPLRRILVPVDFSEASREALTHAIQVARGERASLTLMHAFTVPPHVGATSEGRLRTEEDRESARAAAKRGFEALLEQVPPPDELPVLRRVDEGPAVECIVSASADADLVVMSTHGRGGLARLVEKSVAAQVLRRAHAPVLTFRMSLEALLADRQKRRERRLPEHAVYALFDGVEALGEAYQRLVRAGLPPEALSMITDDLSFRERLRLRERTVVFEGLATGGLLGGALGSSVAVLAAIGAGITGGPVLFVLGPAFALAAIGGLAGGLVGLGLPRESAEIAHRAILDGKLMLGAHARSEEQLRRAQELMFEAGGEMVDLET